MEQFLLLPSSRDAAENISSCNCSEDGNKDKTIALCGQQIIKYYLCLRSTRLSCSTTPVPGAWPTQCPHWEYNTVWIEKLVGVFAAHCNPFFIIIKYLTLHFLYPFLTLSNSNRTFVIGKEISQLLYWLPHCCFSHCQCMLGVGQPGIRTYFDK